MLLYGFIGVFIYVHEITLTVYIKYMFAGITGGGVGVGGLPHVSLWGQWWLHLIVRKGVGMVNLPHGEEGFLFVIFHYYYYCWGGGVVDSPNGCFFLGGVGDVSPLVSCFFFFTMGGSPY